MEIKSWIDKNTKTKVGIEGNFSSYYQERTSISTLATSTEPYTEVPRQGN